MDSDKLTDLPQKLREVILGAFREEGRRWLLNLPETIEKIEDSWRVKSEKPYQNLSYHYVAPCVSAKNGETFVLKIGFPGEKKNVRAEAKTLELLNGRGVVKLYKFSEKHCCMLLEKLAPGENLKTICGKNDKKAVEIAIKVMRRFWQKPPSNHKFPKLENWFDGLNKAEKINFAPEYVGKAQRFFSELNNLPGKTSLLHGDFHHENILSATREPFLAIDPKGIVGDIGYDLTVFLLNHANWLRAEPDLREKLNGAILQFSKAFKVEPLNIRKWVFAQAVLSAWWTFEETGENWRNELDFAKIWEV